ncbi:hypothetical protein RND71_005470 [Anisodus tanguticus]|uniref:RRM domain-containing protein n=1 Tax=Anisodus tanguticus TaxID=243964 RepID=A0AAE1SSH2_9SOLA|nr:hypothetical protein RND71_005470 [Anisodus tanguticus]
MSATPAILEDEFKKFGPIRNGGIQVRSNRGFTFGFVEFEEANAVQKDIEDLSEHMCCQVIANYGLKVQWSMQIFEVGQGDHVGPINTAGRFFKKNQQARDKEKVEPLLSTYCTLGQNSPKFKKWSGLDGAAHVIFNDLNRPHAAKKL